MILNTNAGRSTANGKGLAPQFLFRVKPVAPKFFGLLASAAAGIQWFF